MSKKIFTRITAVLLVVFLTVGFIPNSAIVKAKSLSYVDYYPDTHKNIGKNVTDLISVAKTQIGYTELSTSTGLPLSANQNSGYTKYGAYFGNPTGAWCAYFVAWCANKAGIPQSVVPKIGNCANAVSWYSRHGRYHSAKTYSPKPGDLIFYNWSGGSRAQHIGIVTGKSSSYIYTVEGNVGGSNGYIVSGRKRTRGMSSIIGYATPNYNDASAYHGSYSFSSVVSGSASKTNGYSLSKYKSSAQLAVFTCTAANISGDNALLVGKVVNNGNLKLTYGGFYIGKSKKNMRKLSKSLFTKKTTTVLKTDLKKTDYKLKADTKYYYCSYVVVNGTTYKGPVYSFKTIDDVPKSMSLTDNDISISVDSTYELLYELYPTEANDKGVIWSSSDDSVATVTDGLISGVSAGDVTITAKTVYGKIKSECKVKVRLNSAENIEYENISDSSVKLKWDYNAEAFSYAIYRSKDFDSEFKKIAEVPAEENPSYTDKKLKKGEKYYYKVACISCFGDYNSYLGDDIYAEVKLPAPININATQKGLSSTISWQSVENSTGYTIYRSETEIGIYKLIGTSKEKYFTDENTLADKKYYYEIRAESDNEKANSEFSRPVSITIDGSVSMPDISTMFSDIQTETVILNQPTYFKNLFRFVLKF